MLEAGLENTGPVILHKAQLVIIVKDPLRFWLHLCVFDLAGLLFNSCNINTVEEANLEEYSPEKCEVVVVSEADHAAQHVVLLQLVLVIEQLCYVEHFGDGDKSFDHTRGLWVPVRPIQIECHHLRKL